MITIANVYRVLDTVWRASYMLTHSALLSALWQVRSWGTEIKSLPGIPQLESSRGSS